MNRLLKVCPLYNEHNIEITERRGTAEGLFCKDCNIKFYENDNWNWYLRYSIKKYSIIIEHKASGYITIIKKGTDVDISLNGKYLIKTEKEILDIMENIVFK